MILFLAWNRDGDATRGRLMAAIRSNPGAHTAALADLTGLAWSTVDYHVRVLRRGGFLNVVKDGRECYAYATDIPAMHHSWFAVLRDTDTVRVLRQVISMPALGVPLLSDQLGFTEKVIRRHLTGLEETQLVLRKGIARPVFEPNWEVIRALPRPLQEQLTSMTEAPAVAVNQ